MLVSKVPLATKSPRERVDVLPSSSIDIVDQPRISNTARIYCMHIRLTSGYFLHIIQHQVHQLIKTFERASNLPPASEFDADGLVRVLPQVENVFFLGLL